MEGEKKADEEEDDFQTDEDEEMEVDNQVLQKRKKVCRNLKNIFNFFVLMHRYKVFLDFLHWLMPTL